MDETTSEIFQSNHRGCGKDGNVKKAVGEPITAEVSDEYLEGHYTVLCNCNFLSK